jgi:hypothetical protein
MEKLFSHDTTGIAPELLAMIATHEKDMAAVSPRAFLDHVRVPVFLLHGAGDNVIPPSETLWLAHDTPKSVLADALVSAALQHVELSGEPTVREKWALVDFMSDVLTEAERER